MTGHNNTLLNDFKFSVFGDKLLSDVFFNGSSKFEEYAEHESFRNPGNFYTYHFGINPLGYINSEYMHLMHSFVFNFDEKDEKFLNESLALFRQKARPNSFGVLNSKAPESLEDYTVKRAIGPDYMDTRALLW